MISTYSLRINVLVHSGTGPVRAGAPEKGGGRSPRAANGQSEVDHHHVHAVPRKYWKYQFILV